MEKCSNTPNAFFIYKGLHENTECNSDILVIIQSKLNRPQLFLIQLLVFQYLLLVPLKRKHLKNRILKIIAIIRIGGDKLYKALITAVFCSHVLTPSTPDTTFQATG